MAPLSEDFTKAVQGEQDTDIDKSQQDQNTPEERDAPYPHPVPSWAVQSAEHFAHKQERTPDAFGQIDAQQTTLSGRFKEHSSEQEGAGTNESDVFDRIGTSIALSDRFNTHARDSERG